MATWVWMVVLMCGSATDWRPCLSPWAAVTIRKWTLSTQPRALIQWETPPEDGLVWFIPSISSIHLINLLWCCNHWSNSQQTGWTSHCLTSSQRLSPLASCWAGSAQPGRQHRLGPCRRLLQSLWRVLPHLSGPGRLSMSLSFTTLAAKTEYLSSHWANETWVQTLTKHHVLPKYIITTMLFCSVKPTERETELVWRRLDPVWSGFWLQFIQQWPSGSFNWETSAASWLFLHFTNYLTSLRWHRASGEL